MGQRGKVLMTGATGFIGRAIAHHLHGSDRGLVFLGRNPEAIRRAFSFPCEAHAWDALKDEPPAEAFSRVTGVVHLAGEPIAAGRWTEDRKRRLTDSRVLGTRNLLSGIAKCGPGGPKVLVSSSAIGFYGDRGDEVLTEESRPGAGFLSELCQAWETEVLGSKIPGLRTVCIRTGIVLGQEGGALQKMLPPFRLGLGGPVAGGRQWMSWITLTDLVSLFDFALSNPTLTGPVNGTAPEPVRNADFTRALGHVLHRPAFMPVPGTLLRLGMGESASLVTEGQKVLPAKALKAGFKFRFGEVEAGLRQALAARPSLTSSA
ncbi:MAG TPA: TIGR01777 family oxidoreductase [Bdellovibrionota bacterium]|nr:TIGR01777 family oxidoreductase [Bdellovibrionota bacterium]